MKDCGKLLVKSEHDTKIRAVNETFSQLENLKVWEWHKKHKVHAQKGFVFVASFDTIISQQL